MFKHFKEQYASLQKLLLQKQETIDRLEQRVEELEASQVSGLACIEAVMERGIDWVNFEKLDETQQKAYFNDAKMLLKNETLTNECNRLRADWAKFAISEARDWGAVRDMRMCVNALELLFERLASIPDPHRYESVEEPHAAL